MIVKRNTCKKLLIAVVGVVTLVGVAGCSSSHPARSSQSPRITAPAVSGTALIGDTGSSFTNSVPETPWWQAMPPAPQPPRPVNLAWNLSSDVLFDSGSATLSPSATSQLEGIIRSAQEHPGATIVVTGYTDNVPDPSFPGGNLGLSQARASSVASLISSAHIPGDHIRSIGMGAADPVADESTPAGQQACRRVTISLTAP
jgi:outer membrane protein OmpA-like peptidoglycan-associated protein